jgi:serine protease Do
MVSLAKPGEKVGMEVWRDGKLVHLTATLGSDKGEPADTEQVASVDKGAKLGLALRQLEPAERREAGLPSGLVVEDAGGASAIAGVQPGDVLLAVNGTPVTSVAQVRDVVAKSAKSVALLIQRGDEKIFIPVRIG